MIQDTYLAHSLDLEVFPAVRRSAAAFPADLIREESLDALADSVVVWLGDAGARAPNRWRYMYTWGWLDLASSIPTLEVARWGRAARVARIFRVLRGVRATKILGSLAVAKRTESTFLAVALVAILLLVGASISILQVETVPESNIKTAENALWWALTTITTVVYGDRFPVTAEGRFVASLLMCAGVGLFGTFSGFLAAWFVAPARVRSRMRSNP